MFESFFLAGFECATGYNKHREWIDQVAATHHDLCAEGDYQLLRDVGIRAARESIRWPLVDRGGRFDFGSVESCLRASREHGVTVIWDLFHYGYPDGLDLFGPEFPVRFADYCFAAARHVAAGTEGACYFTPINEPSYFAWAAGHAGIFAPHERGRAAELKRALADAAIRGIDAIRAACPQARIISADPLCRVVAPPDRPDLEAEVARFNDDVVFETWDMLEGRLAPELGGSPGHLDVVGINYYWTNQWDITRPEVPLEDHDPRRRPLRELVRSVSKRYGREILITETSHRDEMRAVWLLELALECEAVLDEGVPLRGVCLYPILGMPEWHAQQEWTRMGLWDLHPCSPTLARVVCEPMLLALRDAQRLEGRQHPALHRTTGRMLPAVSGPANPRG